MKLVLIGCGNRSSAYAYHLKDSIGALCDSDINKAVLLNKTYDLRAKLYDSFEEALKYESDGIIIATPDYTHMEVFLKALETKKPILLEKPMEATYEKAKAMYEKGKSYSSSIVMGYVLRYTFMYSKILELLKNREIGEVITIEANEILDRIHGASFFRRWHKYLKNSGGMINTKCSHDIDIINLIADSTPLYVSSFGSNSHFTKHKGMKSCNSDCKKYITCKYVDNKEYIFSPIDVTLCPYNEKCDIVDHQVVNIEYENKVTAVFTFSMHGAKGNREITVYGSEGTIHASFENQIVTVEKTHPYSSTSYEPTGTTEGHGGGDMMLCEYFKKIVDDKSKINQLRSAYMSFITAYASEISRTEKRVVNIKDIFNL